MVTLLSDLRNTEIVDGEQFLDQLQFHKCLRKTAN